MAPKGKILLGYFFGPRRPEPDQSWLNLRPAEAALVGMFGDLHLWKGKWPIAGQLLDWDRTKWPIPLFLKRDPLGRLPDQVVIYDDDDIGGLGRWERRAVISEGLRQDGLMGAGFVEIKLDMLLPRA